MKISKINKQNRSSKFIVYEYTMKYSCPILFFYFFISNDSMIHLCETIKDPIIFIIFCLFQVKKKNIEFAEKLYRKGYSIYCVAIGQSSNRVNISNHKHKNPCRNHDVCSLYLTIVIKTLFIKIFCFCIF